MTFEGLRHLPGPKVTPGFLTRLIGSRCLFSTLSHLDIFMEINVNRNNLCCGGIHEFGNPQSSRDVASLRDGLTNMLCWCSFLSKEGN